jgi:Na+-transporting NADH:ubiquinone oxidoreductase subunit NqrB
MLPLDARLGQILALSIFLFLGVATRDWTLQPEQVSVIVLTCLITQIGCGWLVWHTHNLAANVPLEPLSQSIYNRLPSALITALGLSLLLRADHLPTLMLASIAAIVSKFLLQVNHKHIFNPANFGIVLALICTQDAWVSPGQWGDEGWYALLFLGAGGLVLKAVGRWDTSLVFLVSYASLEAIRNGWLGWTWDVWLHRLMSGSLLLFALFMITDPRTIPNARSGRIIWSILIAILTFVLRNIFFVSTAMFWALFVLAPLSILLDRWLPEARFEWQRPKETPLLDDLKTQHSLP